MKFLKQLLFSALLLTTFSFAFAQSNSNDASEQMKNAYKKRSEITVKTLADKIDLKEDQIPAVQDAYYEHYMALLALRTSKDYSLEKQWELREALDEKLFAIFNEKQTETFLAGRPEYIKKKEESK